MTAVGWLPAPTEELFGTEATAEEAYELLTVDVPPSTWLSALHTARDELGCTYFDWLSAVDEPGTGFRVSAHVVALAPVRRLLVRTTVPHETPALPTAVDIYAGAAWHERETHEMFGVDFEGHPALDHLLLPETFEGHPLRKDFVLAARVAKAWPGAKEPGESDHGGPKRRQMLPPGVPDPNEWGPLKGRLPAAPARPARGAGRAAGERPVRAGGDRPVRAAGEASARAAGDGPARAAGDRPVRRARSVSEGSVSQAASAGGAVPATEGSVSQGQGRDAGDGTGAGTGTGEQGSGTPAAPRRARSASEGSASQQGTGATPPRRSRSASDGSASQQAPTPAPAVEPESAPATEPSQGPASAREGSTTQPPTAPRSTDAPWHNARPAFEQPEPDADTTAADADAVDADAVEGPDSPPTPEGPAPENPTPDNPAGGSQ